MNRQIKIVRINDPDAISNEINKNAEYYNKFLDTITNEYKEFINSHLTSELIDESAHQISFYKSIIEYAKINERNYLADGLGWGIMKRLVDLKSPLSLIYDHYIHHEELSVSCYGDIGEIILDYFYSECEEGRDLNE